MWSHVASQRVLVIQSMHLVKPEHTIPTMTLAEYECNMTRQQEWLTLSDMNYKQPSVLLVICNLFSNQIMSFMQTVYEIGILRCDIRHPTDISFCVFDIDAWSKEEPKTGHDQNSSKYYVFIDKQIKLNMDGMYMAWVSHLTIARKNDNFAICLEEC